MAEPTTKSKSAEEFKNCPVCKKPMKKARRYYRNGGYYCNNVCFKQAVASAAEAEAKAEEEKPKE